MNSLFLLSCLATLASLAFANEKYCHLTCFYNGRWRDNVGCNKNDELGKHCANDTEYKLSESNRKLIVHLHNEYRDIIAGGNGGDGGDGGDGGEFPKFPIAARMLPMQWDDEHAKLAFYDVKDCTDKTDKCHKTEKYNNPGQNHFFTTFHPWNTKPALDYLIKLSFSTWKNKSNPIVFDQNFSVGCSYVYNSNIFHLICNYPFKPKESQNEDQIYKVGSAIAEDCSEKNKRYTNLCVKADADSEIKNY